MTTSCPFITTSLNSDYFFITPRVIIHVRFPAWQKRHTIHLSDLGEEVEHTSGRWRTSRSIAETGIGCGGRDCEAARAQGHSYL